MSLLHTYKEYDMHSMHVQNKAVKYSVQSNVLSDGLSVSSWSERLKWINWKMIT